jgi:hypothetical protein
VRRDVSQPLGVDEVGLSTGHVLHVLCVAEPQLVEEPFEAVADGLPVDTSGFHPNRLHACVGEPVVEGRVDRVAIRGDPALQVDERGNATSPRPVRPSVESLLARVTLDDERIAETPFEQVGAMQAWVGPGDPHTAVNAPQPRRADVRLVRYADDFVVMVHGTEAHAHALRVDVEAALSKVGLSLKEEKTGV